MRWWFALGWPAFLALVGVLVVPLPSAILDLLICMNIAVAAIVLLAVAPRHSRAR